MAPSSLPWPASSRASKASSRAVPRALAPPAGPRAAIVKAKAAPRALEPSAGPRAASKTKPATCVHTSSKAGYEPLPATFLKDLNKRRQKSSAEPAHACAVLDCPYQRRDHFATCCERCAQALAKGEKHGEGEDYKHTKDCPGIFARGWDRRCDPRYLAFTLKDEPLPRPPKRGSVANRVLEFHGAVSASTVDEKEKEDAETDDRLAAEANELENKEKAEHDSNSDAEAATATPVTPVSITSENYAHLSRILQEKKREQEAKKQAADKEMRKERAMESHQKKMAKVESEKATADSDCKASSRASKAAPPALVPPAGPRAAPKAKAEIADIHPKATGAPVALATIQEEDTDGDDASEEAPGFDGVDYSRQTESADRDEGTAQTSPVEESVRRAAGTAESPADPCAPKTGLRALCRARRVQGPEGAAPPANTGIKNVPLSYARCVPILVGEPPETICDQLLEICGRLRRGSLRHGEPLESSDDPRGSTVALIAPAQVLILVCFQGREAAGEIYERLRRPIEDLVCKLYTS